MKKVKIKKIVQDIVESLCNGDYEKVVASSIEKRGDPDMIREEINSYPGVLTRPPLAAYDNLEIIDIENTKQSIANFFLWFDHERSEMMISILIYDIESSTEFSFWDILVP